MDDTLTTALFVTLIGMAAVFLAMILIFASMRILTTATSDGRGLASDRGHEVPSADVQARNDITSRELQAAAIGVALARAEEMAGVSSISDRQLGGNTAWGEFYRLRQLRPGGRGRTA